MVSRFFVREDLAKTHHANKTMSQVSGMMKKPINFEKNKNMSEVLFVFWNNNV